MDAILQLPPIPPHDEAPFQPVPSRIVAEWPKGTFVENLAVMDDGAIVVSVLSEARLDRVTLDGYISPFHQFDAPPTGLALMDGKLFVAVGEPGKDEPTLWRLDPKSGEGEPWMALSGVIFANGVTPFAPGKLLIAESWHGQLCLVDLEERRVSVWFEDEILRRAPGVDMLPGANGVKRFGHEVTVSSNGRALLVRVPVLADESAGEARILAERVRADDIAYDAHGTLYITTHIGHSLDRLDRHGVRVTLAGPDQGLAGSTAPAFGRHGAERNALYITTTGGIVLPKDGQLQTAKLVRLETGAPGLPLDRAWEGHQ
jgi:hypothetical protein